MRAVILSAPHLKRDLRPILDQVPHAEIVLGEQTPRGEDGCLEMHKAVVRSAKAAGDSAVFVMEDDCCFTPHFDYARWLADAEWAQAQGYDGLVGGCVKTDDPQIVREGLIAVRAFRSAHCLVYFASGYDKVPAAIQPYDYSLGRDCGFRGVVAFPFVAVQRPSYSGILKRPVNYIPEYERHEAQLRHAFPHRQAVRA